MHVLLIEDDALVASGIQAGLEAHDFVVDLAMSLADGRHAMKVSSCDAVVLDLGLPDGDGMTLVREWRESNLDTPILVLTARDALHDRVAGLQGGADDYLLKPFELDELVARLHALIRRAAGRAHPRITHGPLNFDPLTREITVSGRLVMLQRRETTLLEAFLQSPTALLTTDQLKDRMYGLSDDVESNALNVHIFHLRRKLGKGIIETVRGLGYRLGSPEAVDVSQASSRPKE
ncbi:response regulator [Modicisalibacter xianhensis]|uniref:Two component transcriptional regulator, winged helix family n=1 Tax=Modicisalibacter xianhensis TaxID=442341 RepID=A0A1I2Z2R1_9GAMM|nr:response regulator transcription factor [Halomonas xianhensis]SFH32000.1 two component transcriptional regulator, winged helix family [Halomonas xianhensis]